MADLERIAEILERARWAAIDYYALTGKPLGITGEMGEYWAARLLDLQLAEARSPGYDAVDSKGRKVQIKSRSFPSDKRLTGQRVGSIRLDHDWDSVALVLMNELFEPQEIYVADRDPLVKAIEKPGSKARNERGALAVTQFKGLAEKVWG